MTTFTLIAYRPNHDEYYGGYHDGGSDSVLEIKQYNSLDEVVEEGINYYFNEKSEKYDSYYAEWQLTLLIDGKQEFWDEDDVDFYEHSDLRQIYDDKVKEGIIIKKELIRKQKIEAEEERKRLQEQVKIEANIRAKKYQEEQELATYKRLKQKYEPSS